MYSGTLARVALGLLARRRAVVGVPMARKPQIRRRLEVLKRKIWAYRLHRRSATVSLMAGVGVVAGLAGLTLTYAGSPRAGIGVGGDQERPAPELESTGVRILHFPNDRSLGAVNVQDRDIGEEFRPESREHVGPAMGEVSVPADKLVTLVIYPAALKNLSPLSRLAPDDLDALLVTCRQVPPVNADQTILPHIRGLTGLTSLSLNNVNIGRGGLRVVGELKSLRSLTVSSVGSSSDSPGRLDDASLAHLVGLSFLETLRLSSNRITDAGLSNLARLNSLRELRLCSRHIRGPGLMHLAKLPSLVELDLSRNQFGDPGLRYLKKLTTLTQLSIAQCGITDVGLTYLSGLTELEELDLSRNPVTDRGLACLKPMRSLRRLNLAHTRVSEKGLVQLSDLKSLEWLSGVTVGDRGIEYLAQLENLKCLRLGGNVTDAGLEHLASLRHLEDLRVSGERVTDAGMSYVATLGNLRKLTLATPRVTNDGLAKLRTLTSLTKLDLRSENITLSGLNHLGTMTHLSELYCSNLIQDNHGLKIGGLTQLERFGPRLARNSAMRDEDIACLKELSRLKWLQILPGGITNTGMAHLSALTSLEHLVVYGGHGLTDEGLKYLSNMRRLQHLHVTGSFTDRGLRSLEGLSALEHLNVSSENAFSQEAVDRLRKKLPNLYSVRVVP